MTLFEIAIGLASPKNLHHDSGRSFTSSPSRQIVSRIGLETVAIPVQRHLAGCHGVEHVVLEVLEGLSHLCFVHAPIISTNLDHGVWSVPLGKLAHTASHNASINPSQSSSILDSMMHSMSSINCSRAVSISSMFSRHQLTSKHVIE